VSEFDETRWPRPLRWLSISFPLGRWFGIDVRMYATSAFLVLLLWAELSRIHEFTGGEAVGLAFAGAALLYLVVWTHEMGHAMAARAFGVRTPRITLSALGGIAHMSSGAPGPGPEAVIALAGPAVHGLWLAGLVALRPHATSTTSWFVVENLWALNVGLAVFNLLPVFPLDGGRVLRALLARRLHPNLASLWAARVGIVGGAGFIVLGILDGGLRGGLLVLIGFSGILACLREIVLARHTEGPYAPPREPWETDPDAWRGGRSGFDGDDRPASRRGPGVLPRAGRRSATAEASDEEGDTAARHGRSAEDEAELDRLLARVSQVGLAGLSDRERERLRSLSSRH
jgi:Zn-dependent protease